MQWSAHSSLCEGFPSFPPQNAQLYLDVQGNEALSKAFERSKEFGQQSDRMTQIASEARTLADK